MPMAVSAPVRIQMRTSKVFKELLQAWVGGKRRFLAEGGTWATKTYSALQFLILLAKEAKEPLTISIVSESLPHLKRGCIRDFFKILGESQDNNPYWSKTEYVYRRPDWKGVIEFFGADDWHRVIGARRDILFINEGPSIPWETAQGLDVRTTRFTIVDWNPTNEFWAHEHWVGQAENAYSHSTYIDAQAVGVLPQEVVDNIESNRDKDPNWWNVYGLGLIGKIEGLVYPHFEQVDALPQGPVFYGLDYGFASDPTVLVKNVLIGDKLYSQQMFYDYSALTNDQIAKKFSLLNIKNEPIYPDPDEPKSAEELRQKGFNIGEAVKGKGSVEFGIQKVNNYYQYWTKDSLDCIKEQRNFRYIKDRETNQYTDRTTHQWSHGMAARRYAVATYQPAVSVKPHPAVSYL